MVRSSYARWSTVKHHEKASKPSRSAPLDRHKVEAASKTCQVQHVAPSFLTSKRTNGCSRQLTALDDPETRTLLEAGRIRSAPHTGIPVHRVEPQTSLA